MSLTFEPCETRNLVQYDIERQIWRELDLYSDFKSLKSIIRKNAAENGDRITADYADQKVRDFRYTLQLARDYFVSSKTATLATKPTLLYYGIVSLSAALIIFKFRDKSLNSMKESHGLKDYTPPSIAQINSSNITHSRILEIGAEIQANGTFNDLAKMSLSERCRIQIKESNNQITSKDFSQKQIFSIDYPVLNKVDLKDLLTNVPEIRKEIKVISGLDSSVFLANIQIDNGHLVLRFSKEYQSEDLIDKHFPFLINSKVIETSDSLFYKIENDKFNANIPLVKRNTFGQQFLTSILSNNILANDFIIYYLIFFIFGSLSRYKPGLWRVILEDNTNGLGTIPEILCESAPIKLPLFLLSELRNSYYNL